LLETLRFSFRFEGECWLVAAKGFILAAIEGISVKQPQSCLIARERCNYWVVEPTKDLRRACHPLRYFCWLAARCCSRSSRSCCCCSWSL